MVARWFMKRHMCDFAHRSEALHVAAKGENECPFCTNFRGTLELNSLS